MGSTANKIDLPDALAQQTVLLVQEDPFFIAPQGEGKYMGRLSAWVRCTTCNLRCAWANNDDTVTLCDTSYSSHVTSMNRQTVQTVYEYLLDNQAPHVVITGGEPTRQNALLVLIDYLESSGKRVTVETNGTRFFESRASLISLSPKLSSSGSGLARLCDPQYTLDDTDGFLSSHNLSGVARSEQYAEFQSLHNQHRYSLEDLQQFMHFYGPARYQFKFVAHTEADIAEIQEDYVIPLAMPPETVYLMPQGITHEQLQQRAAWVVEQCKQYGYNYSDRLHIRIYGNKPGY